MTLIENTLLRNVVVIFLAFFLAIIIATVSYGISYDVMYKVTSSSMPKEETFSEPLELLRYDVFAETLENKFSEMEYHLFSGAGAGGLGSPQIILDKETFIEKSVGKDVYYSEEIVMSSYQYRYSFIQTYWIIEDGFIYVYEKEYTPPEFYHITKEGNNLVYSLFYPVSSIVLNASVIACIFGIISLLLLLAVGLAYVNH